MSNKNPLATSSTEELTKERKVLGKTAIGLAVAMVVACVILFYQVIKNQKSYLLLVVIPACMLSLIPSFIRLGQLNREIKMRRKAALVAGENS